ncbi:MAG: hypothetical protein FGM22_08305 [Burkholderiaceae bacterium]|nr:hypothetical protein [Burkholderiaceae bacterium]
MTYTIIGTAFPAGGIKMAKDKVTEDARGRKTITSTYRTFYSGWFSEAPVRGTAHGVYPTAFLVEKSAAQIEPGFLCDVTLKYEEPEAPEDSDTEGGNPPFEGATLPPDEYTESANEVEVPIEAHPNFKDFATVANGAIFSTEGDFKGWTKTSPFSGFLTYKVGSVTESVTKYYWGKPASVTSLVGQVEGNWLTVSGSIARRYPYWVRTINRIYSTVPWNTTIYPG